jgi:hypothetical protein
MSPDTLIASEAEPGAVHSARVEVEAVGLLVGVLSPLVLQPVRAIVTPMMVRRAGSLDTRNSLARGKARQGRPRGRCFNSDRLAYE